MKLELEENEVVGIINILGELPTKSNAWPLQQKIVYQYEQEKPKDGPIGSNELVEDSVDPV
jgi:hypothetical protein